MSAEQTFVVDLTDPVSLGVEADLLASRVGSRLRDGGLSARTVVLKVRHYDFTTITRSIIRVQPTDNPRLIAQLARRLLADVDTSTGVRLLGVGSPPYLSSSKTTSSAPSPKRNQIPRQYWASTMREPTR